VYAATSEWEAARSGENVEALLQRFRSGASVDWLDFVVDGHSLGEAFAAIGEGYTSGDLIGCLGWANNKDYERSLVRQLLVEQPPELESGRYLLYVCPECGDIGCGAVTVVITDDNDQIGWERFRYERL
jgi:hypothetical protein